MMNRFLVSLICLSLGTSPAVAHDLRQLAHPLAQAPNASTIIGSAPVSEQARGALFSMIRRSKIWPKSQLTLCFGPVSVVHRRSQLINHIVKVAEEWTPGTSLHLDFYASKGKYRVCTSAKSADIRINVAEPIATSQFVSLIGREASQYSLTGWSYYSVLLPFPDKDPYYGREEVFRFYVLHEIGHALGIDHEHQRLDCGFNYDYIASEFDFPNKAVAQENMQKIFLYRASAYPNGSVEVDSKYISSPYDNYSIMKYNLSTSASPSGDDPRVYVQGTASKCYRDKWASSLTGYDTAGIQAAYRAPAQAAAALVASASTISGLSPKARSNLKALSVAHAQGGLMSIGPAEAAAQKIQNDVSIIKRSPEAVRALSSALEVTD